MIGFVIPFQLQIQSTMLLVLFDVFINTISTSSRFSRLENYHRLKRSALYHVSYGFQIFRPPANHFFIPCSCCYSQVPLDLRDAGCFELFDNLTPQTWNVLERLKQVEFSVQQSYKSRLHFLSASKYTNIIRFSLLLCPSSAAW